MSSVGTQTTTLGGIGGAKRKSNRCVDTDPFRARTLYALAALWYEAGLGIKPRPVDLNRAFPATPGNPQKSGVWNRLRRGQTLPRRAGAPQGALMLSLMDAAPKVAQSYDWPIWRLASSQPLERHEIHGLMLGLPAGIEHMLVGRCPGDRFLRWPTHRALEVLWMSREHSLGGLSALVALMREAELDQDVLTFVEARAEMIRMLSVLAAALGSAVLGDEFAQFLKGRFATMVHIVPGAYQGHPAKVARAERVEIALSTGAPRLDARAEFESLWKKGEVPPDERERRD